MKFKPTYLLLLGVIGISILSCKGQSSSPVIETVKTDTSDIPKPLGFVSDYGVLYTESQKIFIDSLLQDFEDSVSIQLAVFTFDKAMMKNIRIDDYLLNIANSWRVGDKERQTGILVGICAECRSMRIENGFGIEKMLSNNETKKIIESAFFPEFKQNEYYKGTLTGLQTLMAMLKIKIKNIQ